MKKIVLILALVVAAVGGILALRRDQPHLRYEPVLVVRGDATVVLREVGVIAPREPVHVTAGIAGTLEWLAEDGEWVKQGDQLYIISSDEAMKQVTKWRSDLLAAQQELALARMRRRHVLFLQQQKVQAAQRAVEIERARHTILSTPPKGGCRLIELHEQLLPLESQTRLIQQRYQQAQEAFQVKQDAYLEALNAWQQQKDAIVQTQAKIDEATLTLEQKVDEGDAKQVEQRDAATKKRQDAKAELERLREGLPALEQQLNAARQEREAAKQPRDELRRKLQARHEIEKQLHLEIEIEKVGAGLAQLQLDGQIAQMQLQEARRKHEEATSALANGAISQTQFEKRQSDVAVAGDELKIVEENIKIASRPAPPEVLLQARLKMEQAEARAQDAEAGRDQVLRMIDQEIALVEAKIAEAERILNRWTNKFAITIEFNIKFLKKELEALDESETDRKAEIEKELAQSQGDLADARKNPPNVGRSKIAGVVHLNERWGRHLHAGDDVNEDHVIMRVYPVLNMEVQTAINEADKNIVRKGMQAQITVPALDHRRLKGTIVQVEGIGKDKSGEDADGDRRAMAGVTQFDARIQLDDVPSDLRPGMTALVNVVVEEHHDVLQVPRGAVRLDQDGAFVWTGSAVRPAEKRVQGRVVGHNTFVIESGLSAGQTVFVARKSGT